MSAEADVAWGKDRLGHISKQGDRYLRSLFVAGALAVIRYAKIHGTKHRPWLTALLARRVPCKLASGHHRPDHPRNLVGECDGGTSGLS